MMEIVTFGGNVLSDYYPVIGEQRPLAGKTNEFQTVAGSDGAKFTGSTLGQCRLSMRMLVLDRSKSGMRDAMRTIMPLLQSDGPQQLSFSSDDGLYYMAVLDGEQPFAEYIRNGYLQVNFVTDGPAMYGETKTVTVPSGGTATIYVGGTYPTYVRVEGNVSGDATSHMWGVRLDEGDYMHIVTQTTEARNVVIDSGEGVGYVQDTFTLPTMDSDWFVLKAGVHTIRNDVGSGACTVTWQERWL